MRPRSDRIGQEDRGCSKSSTPRNLEFPTPAPFSQLPLLSPFSLRNIKHRCVISTYFSASHPLELPSFALFSSASPTPPSLYFCRASTPLSLSTLEMCNRQNGISWSFSCIKTSWTDRLFTCELCYFILHSALISICQARLSHQCPNMAEAVSSVVYWILYNPW